MNVGFGEEGVVEFECCFEGFGVFLVNGGGWWVSKVRARVCVSLFFSFLLFCCFLFLDSSCFSLPSYYYISLAPQTTTTNTYITLLQKPNRLQRLLNIRNLILQASNTTFVIGFHELIFPND